MASIVGTSPQFNFSNDFLANGLAGDLYGYGMDVGLSSNQSAYHASQIAAPFGSSNAALNNQQLGDGSDMRSPSALSKIGSALGGLFGSALPGMGASGIAGGSVLGGQAGQAASDKLKDLSISRIATILAGIILVGFGLYFFGSSSISSALSGLANKVTA